MSNKTPRNTKKFESLNYLTQGFNSELIPKLDLTGKIKQRKDLTEKRVDGPDLPRSGLNQAGLAHIALRSGTGAFFFLASRSDGEAARSTAMMARRLRSS